MCVVILASCGKMGLAIMLLFFSLSVSVALVVDMSVLCVLLCVATLDSESFMICGFRIWIWTVCRPLSAGRCTLRFFERLAFRCGML